MSANAAPAQHDAARPALGGVRAWLAWLVAVAFVVYYFSFQTGYAIVNASVQKELSLSVAQVGMIAAAYTWVFAVFQLLSGPTLDRLGARRVLLPAIVLVTAGIVLFANARSFEALLLSQALVAIGASTGFVGAGYVGGQWFGMAKFSFMFGLVQFAASIFSVINQNLLGWVLSTASWRSVFWTDGLLGLVLLFAAYAMLRDPVPVAGGGGFGRFFADVGAALGAVARVPHVWMAAVFGALCFGPMLALGVVWGPKLLAAHGLDTHAANVGTSLLWLGLAAGCFVAPWMSDRLRRRKWPVLVGIVLQLLALAALIYVELPAAALLACCFLFGFGNAAHMLAFSTAGDVVEPRHIGTSAAIVNGLMFVVGGILISRPGLRIGLGIEEGLAPASLEIAQYAARPLMISVIVALIVAASMRETYPQR
ncbi:MFS transporter [Lysobacter sp. A6]|uniref:MFS transporter n=1 Tax=Noviluteimonas lactosilytica TaxID=2888523 RepID=A0ABS8JDJ1_9GAMM|nr:MFS transporter [Lysobacter lactosilyticus]MCC8361681.1 MFS transporter [Lysobacter lactosilyticus]